MANAQNANGPFAGKRASAKDDAREEMERQVFLHLRAQGVLR